MSFKGQQEDASWKQQDLYHCTATRQKTELNYLRDRGPRKPHSENWNVVVDFGAVPLGNALCDPDDVPALLLLQLDVGVKDAEVELVEEGQLVQLHLEIETV